MKSGFDKHTDSELVTVIREGDRKTGDAAFVELYNRYSASVRAYCKCMINSSEQAEDIFQETFISLYNNIKKGCPIDNVSAYLIGTARNQCFNFIRNRKVTVPINIDDFVIDERRIYENAELFDLIVRSLDLLDYSYREAFVMREFQGLSYHEIARCCNITVSGAKSRVERAHKKLVKILSPYVKDLAK